MKLFKAKAPMRIGFFGGGTDVSPYAEEHGGKVLNCTIDKYVRCMLKPTDQPGITIRSLDLSAVSRAMTGREWSGKLSLPQAVIDAHPEISGVEITMFSDVPPGSGLGSSSALVVSMLKLLDTAYNLKLDAYEMAELAYRIERVDLGIPGGRQDQYTAVFGGMAVQHFGGPQVIIERVATNEDALLELESCLIIGYVRDRKLLTHNLVQDQVRRVTEGETLRLHDETKAMVDEGAKLLRRGQIKEFGKLLHHAWEIKKAFSPHIAPPIVNEIYDLALRQGAWGGKLSGAGGGGFMCFCVPFSKRLQLEAALIEAGVTVRPFSFTKQGVHAWSVEEDD
ncbi:MULTISPECIES: GHMP kinase [Herpetosiphon]|uniref:GHMP kinase n=1 Tax=Herpetosiphon geysericola TaxID=70996 RepID=A0A0P6Y9A3_9CHLR|nr:GHMP kinase [Herpetosiphon geysericola]KPL81894.1 GHMP kinase [Herpetosiphon geysericola]MBM7845916.1 D-glycero-alpha-D-manno-heptose-7-phosphate kinase [Herpetosiphon giganteus]